MWIVRKCQNIIIVLKQKDWQKKKKKVADLNSTQRASLGLQVSAPILTLHCVWHKASWFHPSNHKFGTFKMGSKLCCKDKLYQKDSQKY